MKILSSLFIILAFTLSFSAQEKSAAKWTRIESENKDFTISLPPNFIVDAEKRERGQRYEIVGYLNGVRMQLKVYADRNAKNRLKELQYQTGTRINEFTANGFKGKRITSEEFSKTYFEWINLASEDYFYFISVKADSKDKEELKRFLYSINVGGKQLFQQKEKPDFSEETVSLNTLKTSPEVLEAFNRKSEKNKINVTYESDSSQIESGENDEKFSRAPIILHRPFPSWRPTFDSRTPSNETYVVKLKINFLASGQIGDIIVYSNSKKEFINACVDSARKIKFVPAQIDGKNVDAAIIENYTMQVFTMSGY